MSVNYDSALSQHNVELTESFQDTWGSNFTGSKAANDGLPSKFSRIFNFCVLLCEWFSGTDTQ